MSRSLCYMRGLVQRDPDGKCYPMDKPCKEVPDDICAALQVAYDMSRFEMINIQYTMCKEAIEEGWKNHVDKYQMTNCPTNENGVKVMCSTCRLYKECFKS